MHIYFLTQPQGIRLSLKYHSSNYFREVKQSLGTTDRTCAMKAGKER